MVEPVAFRANEQTAADNRFQKSGTSNAQDAALAEHRAFRQMLLKNGVLVTVVQGIEQCPDDVFCNNWISTHEGGMLILYPMKAENRRLERRTEIIEQLTRTYTDFMDLSYGEQEGFILEGTGSMILDRPNRIAYASLSDRCHPELFTNWCREFNYRPIPFKSEVSGVAPYHTNVIMYLGTKVAGLCTECIVEGKQEVLDSLESTGHELVDLTIDQINQFAGNALEVQSLSGDHYLVMSTRAYNAYREDQLEILGKHYKEILHSDLTTIEDCGGGSARCMMLELF